MHGPHLMLDCYECEENPLNSMDKVYEFLDKLPSEVGMHKLTRPYVFHYKDCEKIEQGITGFVIIAESHISIHTYPNKKYFTMDVYSCKSFDVDKVIKMARDFFGVGKLEKQFVERGMLFKQTYAREKPITIKTRRVVKVPELSAREQTAVTTTFAPAATQK